ncbi:MAG: hypothetical protein ACI8P3_003605 [Saprospiraceae bacterium]|jgi:hypothetical protein
MRKLAAFFNIWLLLLMTTVSYSQSQVEKTLVKSFNLKGNNVVVLDLTGELEIKEWKNDIMRIQMTIRLDEGTNSMLKSLIQNGRYNLVATDGADDFKIFAPSMNKEIKVHGKVLKENIVYTVFAPENVTVKMAGEASTNASTSGIVPSSK